MAVLLPARADSIPPPGTPPTQFSISGPAADQIQYQIFADETGEFNALQAGQIDLTDTPLNPPQVPIFCPTGTSFWCTGVAPNPPDGAFGFQLDDINLANNFWGITFCFAQDGITAGGACQPNHGAVTVPGYPFPTASCPNVPAPHTGDCTFAGTQWRQGFAALLNKQGLVANVFGGAAASIDNIGEVPAQAIAHSGYSFDASCQPSLAAGCVGPYSSGAYNLKGVCSWDSLHTTTVLTNCTSALNYPGTNPSTDGITWDAGSTNFCNAADHFIAAGIASGKDVNCRLTTLLGPGGDVVMAIRSDSPNRLASGNAEFNRFCDLLNAPISAGQCSRLTDTGGTLRLVGHSLIVTDAFTFVFSGSSTDGVTTNTPNLDWNIYTGANSIGPAFNQQWGFYDSVLASTICGGLSAVPASPTGDFPLSNHAYSCNPTMDHYMEMTENNVTIPAAATADQVAMEIFGNHTLANPTVSLTQQFAYRKGWTGISDATGVGIASGNFWSLSNGWNPSPAIAGPAIRWGMKQGISTLNPFETSTVFEANILQEVYDTLLAFTPYIPTTGSQIIGYMSNSYKLVSHTGAVGEADPLCPSLAGLPAVGLALKTDPLIRYVDANGNNVWNFGESVVYDSNNNGGYNKGEPVIFGATPPTGTKLKTDPLIRYVDANGNNVWNFGESVVYDTNNNGVYDAGEQVIAGATPLVGTFPVQGCIRLDLRGDIFFQDGVQVTASDVKFSFENFNATGGGVSGATLNTVDVVYDPAVLPSSLGGIEGPGQSEIFYVALKSANAFALLDIGGVPIVPQHLWKTIGASGPCEDTTIPGSGKGSPQCTVDPTYLSGPGADPVVNNRLIGSGPYVCASGPYNALGTVLGGGCTSTGTSAVTTGTITLFRYGQGVSHLSGNYFRNNAKYKEFAWADTSGIPGQVDVFDISAISGCFANPAGATCPHYRAPDTTLTCTGAGPCIGTVSGGNGGPLTGLQKADVVQWYGTSWTSPLAYGALDGIVPAPPVLYDDGSQYS